MTTLGLQYLQAQEAKRSNLAREYETNRSNLVNESIARGSLDEQIRSHKATERISEEHNIATRAETQRHNLAQEQETARSNLARENEAQRHNIASEKYNLLNLAEMGRHNTASENLSQQANRIAADRVSNEQLAALSNIRIAQQNADTNRINAVWGGINNSVRALNDVLGLSSLLQFAK